MLIFRIYINVLFFTSVATRSKQAENVVPKVIHFQNFTSVLLAAAKTIFFIDLHKSRISPSHYNQQICYGTNLLFALLIIIGLF